MRTFHLPLHGGQGSVLPTQTTTCVTTSLGGPA